MIPAIPAALAIYGGCGADPSPPDAGALRDAFPERAAEVLQYGEGFTATAKGFTAGATRVPGGHRAITAELPRLGNEAIRLRLKDGFEVRVRELSAEGEGAMVEQAIAYRRAGGTAYWTAGPDKVEEWLHLTVRRGEVAAAWEVEGAALEQRGENVALVDNEGVARLWVSAPAAFAAGGRPVQPALRAANGRIELEVKDVEGEVLVDPAWAMLPPMSTPRVWHAAAPITKARVLVAGGSNGPMFLASTEAFNTKTESWEPLPSMAKGRDHHTLTVLDTGDVLVVGGFSGMYENSAELFSVDTDTWSALPPMAAGRSRHTATRLGNGIVLVVGGMGSSGALGIPQTFNPYTKSWGPSFSSTARMAHTATLLGDGTVLVVGGEDADSALASAEIYVPPMNSWIDTNPLSTPRSGHTATLLFDGRVLVTGGSDVEDAKNPIATGEIYEPGTQKWSPIANMTEARVNHTAVALSSGKVLVMGGSIGPSVSKTAEMYDPEKDIWLPAGHLGTAREGHTATPLSDGRVIIAGGKNPTTLASAEMFKALPLASPCQEGSECFSGFCSDGVCCNAACASACDACSVEAGSDQNGLCKILDGKICDPCAEMKDGSSCNDGDACTEMDTCASGVCTAGKDKICEAFDACHMVGECDSNTGSCSNPDVLNCELPEERPTKPTVTESYTLCEIDNHCGKDGHCVDGVCCDSACDKKCHSCVVPGSVGKCSPALAGTDPGRDCVSPDKPCDMTCPGDSSGECVAASAGTECAPNQCFFDGIHGATAVTCSARNDTECSSADRIPFNCSPYRCIAAFGACSTSCSKLSDCAEPYVCSPDGECVPAPAVSSGYASSCSFALPIGESPASSRASLLSMLIAAILAARRRRSGREYI